MPYRKLGDSGLSVSALSFGSWVTFGKQMQVDSAKECIKYAFDNGVNFFDNAEVYANGQSEEFMGEAFRQLGLKRNEYILTTKFFWGIENRINFKNTLNRKYLMQAINGSLARLKMDFVDVAYCHRYDPETPIHEICYAMDQMIRDGKALYWGTSEWPALAIDQAYTFALENSLHRPIVEQPQYNLLNHEKVEKEFHSLYQNMKLGLTTWSPLASGILTGKYLNGIPENSRASMSSLSFVREEAENRDTKNRVSQLLELSKKSGVSMSHLAIGWCLLNQNVSTVILGASRLEQLKENLDTLKYLDKIAGMKKELDALKR
ncbi:MAG: aldo/keto reductase [Pseudobdellovibrio sp.]